MASKKRTKQHTLKMAKLTANDMFMLDQTAQFAVALIEGIPNGARFNTSDLMGLAVNFLALYQKTYDGISGLTRNISKH